ncbi:MAG: hypothetical protein ACQEXJ_18445 [Myxococcota bacterium]
MAPPHSERPVLRACLRTLVALLILCVGAAPALGAWAGRSDLTYGSAYTLDQGEFEVGVFTPLQYGVSDRVQVALHPILLLILAPKVSTRWRVTREGPVAFAVDVDATWSFLDQVDDEGRRLVDDAACRDECGFPGTAQLTGTVSWEPTDGLLLSAGTGPAADFLDVAPQRFMLAMRGSVLWLLGSDDLVMLHANTLLHPWSGSGTSRTTVQAMYAHAWGNIHLGAGIAVGDFALVVEEDTVRTLPGTGDTRVVYEGETRALPVWPVIDLWIRL